MTRKAPAHSKSCHQVFTRSVYTPFYGPGLHAQERLLFRREPCLTEPPLLHGDESNSPFFTSTGDHDAKPRPTFGDMRVCDPVGFCRRVVFSSEQQRPPIRGSIAVSTKH